MPIKRGDTVRIKPEYQDAGDDQVTWLAIEDEDGGRVRIEAQLDLPIKPNQVVSTDMLHKQGVVMSVYDLARKFASELTATLTDEQMEKVQERNEFEYRSGVCHSHDFCDANQVMIAAVESLGGEFDPQDEKTMGLIDRAWNIAKSCGFDTNDITQEEML